MALKRYPKPGGPMVKFYLGKSRNNGVWVNPEVRDFIPCGVNGYNEVFEMGKEHVAPKEWVDHIMAQKSRVKVPDAGKAERNPRDQNEYRANYRRPGEASRWEYVPDYEVHIIEEKGS